MPRLRRPPARVRLALQLGASGALLAYLLWRIDLHRTATIVAHARVLPLATTLALFVGTTWPLAWRWRLVLAAKGIHEPLAWLTRLYFVGQAASQVLPTAIGGDAVRILEHARRRPDRKGDVAAAVLVERAAGAAATFALAGVGLGLAAATHAQVRVFLPAEAALGATTLAVAYLLFAARMRPLLARLEPLARRLRVDRPARGVYGALHAYRDSPGVLVLATALSFAIQAIRVGGIWLCGVAVGLHLSPLPYLVLGPLLLLIMLIPITINGIGVREAFFVTFLGRYGVDASSAFAAGFLFFAATLVSAAPGALVLATRGRQQREENRRPGETALVVSRADADPDPRRRRLPRLADGAALLRSRARSRSRR